MRREFLAPFDRKRLSEFNRRKKYRRRCCILGEIFIIMRPRLLRLGGDLWSHSLSFRDADWILLRQISMWQSLIGRLSKGGGAYFLSRNLIGRATKKSLL